LIRERTLSQADFVWLIGSLCQINRIPFDAKLMVQRFPAPHSRRQLAEVLQALDFKTGEHLVEPKSFAELRFPCVGFLKGPHEDGDARPALFVKADAERLLHFPAGSQTASIASVRQFAEQFEPGVLLVRHESAAPVDLGDGAAPASKFGFRWFWNELLRHKRVWRDVLAASFFLQLIGLTTPLFTQVIIDKVVVHHTQSTLAVIALGLVMFMLFSAGMSWLRQYLVIHTGNRVHAVLASQVFKHLLRLVLPYFESRPTGTLVARVHAVETIREFTAGAAVSLLLDFPFLFVFLALMFFYSWQLTLIALGVLALIVAMSLAVVPLLRARINHQFLLGARNQAFLTEYVSGIETVKSLQMEPRLESRYDELLAQYLAAGFSTKQVSNTYNTVANALEQTMTLSILCAGALLVMRNDGFTIGMLVAFQMFASRMSQPMLRLAGLWQEFQQASIAVKRLGDIMDAPPEPYSLTPARLGSGKGEIEIRDVSFRYSPAHPYLFRKLDLTVKANRLTVLTGPSGSGKSTLAKLLLGFYPPHEGRILLDSRDIETFSANELRQYFGVVPQETVLFSGTIYENLIAANANASLVEVAEACKLAEIHDVIEQLPQGYNTLIGEHGVGLSGGQKQRLAIARALLKHPKILIFDEATSSLDQATADRFAHTVNRLKGEITIFVIAHQFPRGLHVDDLIALNGGKTIHMHSVEEQQP